MIKCLSHGPSAEDAYMLALEERQYENGDDDEIVQTNSVVLVERPGPVPTDKLADWILDDSATVPMKYRAWVEEVRQLLAENKTIVALKAEYKVMRDYRIRRHLQGKRFVEVFLLLGRSS